MSTVYARWRGRLAIRRALLKDAESRLAYRRRKHDFYHHESQRPDAERKALATKWHKLVEEAERLVSKRREQVAYAERVVARHKPQPKASARSKAVSWAKAQVGTVENPYGSNRGGKITEWQQALGSWLVGLAWCGTFCAAALRHAGVSGVNFRMASVAFIEDDARAHRGPFRGWTNDASKVMHGDLVVLFGRGVHVELVERVSGGYVYTIGGNTSSGNAGSQNNGGGVYRRVRPLSAVHGFALVDYPG